MENTQNITKTQTLTWEVEGVKYSYTLGENYACALLPDSTVLQYYVVNTGPAEGVGFNVNDRCGWPMFRVSKFGVAQVTFKGVASTLTNETKEVVELHRLA
jgi:hypothetical protein